MLNALEGIGSITKILEASREKKAIDDYRISLKLNMEVSIYIIAEKENAIDLDHFEKNESIVIEWLTPSDLEEDHFFQAFFAKPHQNRLILSVRRRLSSLLNYKSSAHIEPQCPVITFYSYKGGMGRSTALASFASYAAIHQSKRVIIIDCDFEAPGFVNYFDLNPETLSQKSGIIEYLQDKQFGGDLNLEKNYLVQASHDYSGEGEIYIMPAGNLSNEFVQAESPDLGTHKSHYLEGLSRLDLSATESMVQRLNGVIEDLVNELDPDLILIDSRTGFNDVFGILAYQLSSLVVGFFGNNQQTLSGLQFFLDALQQGEKKIDFILVNSIISSLKFLESFKKETLLYLDEHAKESPTNVEIYPITRDVRLENIGTEFEYKPDFIDLIQSQKFSDYNDLFDAILRHVQEAEDLSKDLVGSENIRSYKSSILESLKTHLPKLYGEQERVDQAFLKEKFYFRKCMLEIFNMDKILMLGGKGTGKTLLYKALKSEDFIKGLQEKVRKKNVDYCFIDIISTSDEKEAKKRLKTDQFSFDQIQDHDYFFKRFWVVYIWNSIMLDAPQKIGFESDLSPLPITDHAETKKRFQEAIEVDEQFIQIERELLDLDQFLKERKINLVVLFDQLDFIVEPIHWPEAISPLINFWRSNPYSQIFPKLFIRSDLFQKLQVTNKQELRSSQSTSIEWSQEEIFAFFFKVVLVHSRDKFFQIMNFYQQRIEGHKEKIQEIQSIIPRDNQVPLHRKYLKPMVEVFYGKWPGTKRQFGESYDWFFRNLKNADDTISLRPFLDLNQEAINDALQNDQQNYPILPGKYFSSMKARTNAVKRHFDDLASEKGNRDLYSIFQYIREEAVPELKISFLEKDQFHRLLQEVVDKYQKQLDFPNRDDLKNLLIVNGIISEINKKGGHKVYRFAFLYKYYLALKK